MKRTLVVFLLVNLILSACAVEGRRHRPTAGDRSSNVGGQGREGDKRLAESGDRPKRVTMGRRRRYV